MKTSLKQKDNIRLRPIGFFDSGVGGLSVLRQSVNLLPGEDFVYLGDNRNVPYGTKSEDEIRLLALDCAEFLYRKNVKAIVVACNTATSIAVREMREKYNIPVISIEPAVKPALESPLIGKILVMATPATLSQTRYRKLLERLGHTERIINVPCEGLAELIECGELQGRDIYDYVENKLRPYSGMTISGIVLGCTHYSFIGNLIRDVGKSLFSSDFEIFDGRFGVARRLKSVLEENDICNLQEKNSHIDFYVTGDRHEIAKYRDFFVNKI